MPNESAPAGRATVQIAHAIPGRLRLRLLGGEWTDERLDALALGLDALRGRRGIGEVELKRSARGVIVRYEPDLLDEGRVLALAERAGLALAAPDDPAVAEDATRLSDSTEGLAALIGIPTSFDRRLVENLALSGISLLAARGVMQALGGGPSLVAYLAIWYGLRHATGLGRRR